MQNRKGFTLVELIVVITILAILGTIAFISLQGYSSESRDSKRISDLQQIRIGLQIEQAREGEVPIPENAVSIGTGSTVLLYQGYAGTGTLNELRVSEAKDPVEDIHYTYTTNSNRTKFQLVAMLENEEISYNTNNIITKTYSDYENRIPFVIGDPLGILLDSITNTPIQELSFPDNKIDLSEGEEYTLVTTREDTITSSGAELVAAIEESSNNTGGGTGSGDGTGGSGSESPTLTGWRAVDTNCEIEDITIGNQTWAGCNSTLGDGIEFGQLDSDVGNNTYNGTLNSSVGCYGYDSTVGNNNNECTFGSSMLSSSGSTKEYFDMKQPTGSNSNLDSEYDTIWGKLYTYTNAVNSACPSGWHLPTDEEWKELTTNLNSGTICESGTGWQCSGLGWNGDSGTKDRALANALKLPLAGSRSSDGYTFNYRGRSTYLWSDTIDSSTGDPFIRFLHWNFDTVSLATGGFDIAFSVRCIKD